MTISGKYNCPSKAQVDKEHAEYRERWPLAPADTMKFLTTHDARFCVYCKAYRKGFADGKMDISAARGED